MMNFLTAGLQWHSDMSVRTSERTKENCNGAMPQQKKSLVEILDLLPAGFVLHDAAVLPQHTKIETVRNERQHYERRL